MYERRQANGITKAEVMRSGRFVSHSVCMCTASCKKYAYIYINFVYQRFLAQSQGDFIL